METFQQFHSDINILVFPEGRAERRVPMLRNFVVNGLIMAQTYVESYQSANVNFYDKRDGYDDCGVSIFPGPRGQIGAIYAFRPDCRCERYYFSAVSLEKMSCFYDMCRCNTSTCTPCGEVGGVTLSPYCGYLLPGTDSCYPPYLAALPESDTNFKLADKYFAIGPDHKLWCYPRLPCGYVLAVHWRGIKRIYLDTDYVFDDEDLKDTIASYVEAENASRIDNDGTKAQRLMGEYRFKLQDIIYREERDLKPRTTRLCAEGLDLSILTQIYPDNLYGQIDGPGLACDISAGTDAGCCFSGGWYYLKSPADLWHKVAIAGPTGGEYFTLGPGITQPDCDATIAPSGPGYLFSGGYFHLMNISTGQYTALLATGSPSTFIFLPRQGTIAEIRASAYGYILDPCPCVKVKNLATGGYCSVSLLETTEIIGEQGEPLYGEGGSGLIA